MTVARAGTEVEAANEALGHLGQPAIAQLSDSNIRARAARLFFGGVRDTLQRKKWWSFCKAWTTPAADTVAGAGPLSIRYPLPADCLRVRYLLDSAGAGFEQGLAANEPGAWDIEGGNVDDAGAQVEAIILVTNVAAPKIAFNRRVENVRLWWPDFLDVFSLELASKMAKKLGRSDGFARGLHADAEALLATASGIDSKEQSPQTQVTRTPSWLAARGGWRGARRFPWGW